MLQLAGARSERTFLGVSALVFVASAAATVLWCASMASMDGMPMPGGWTMSMAWMRMPGQTWTEAAATFLGMWTVMMVAMMLPCLVPMLARYRAAAGRSGLRTTIVASGYFAVWTGIGIAAFPIGVALASIEMREATIAHAVPFVAGAIVLAAGLLQLTKWKARGLACCRQTGRAPATAWSHGIQLGLRCAKSCGNLMALLLVLGVMDLRAMAVVTAAITFERVLPSGERVARVTGSLVAAAGVFLLAQAVAAQ
jgi:predicted metal-binding membrane protein